MALPESSNFLESPLVAWQHHQVKVWDITRCKKPHCFFFTQFVAVGQSQTICMIKPQCSLLCGTVRLVHGC